MASGTADSVTDHQDRAHGVTQLHLADLSLVADSIGINPSPTIVALANRVAEGVLEDFT